MDVFLVAYQLLFFIVFNLSHEAKAEDVQGTDSPTSQKVTAFNVTDGQTYESTTKLVSSFTSSPASVKPTLGVTTAAEQKPFYKTQRWILYLVPPGIGVGLGIVLLVGLLCSRWRSDKSTCRRSRLKFNETFVGMMNFTNGGLLPVEDEDGYNMVSSTPAVDSATESVQVNTQDSKNENPEVHHFFSTLPDEPVESTVESGVYYATKAH